MLKVFLSKCKEALISVLPVSLIVVILHMTPLISLTDYELGVFLVCSFFLILGIGLFNLGADLAMTPIGEHVGSGLARSRNLWLLLSVCFVMGVLITVAEPDLSVLAAQVADVINGTALTVAIGVGVGVFLVLSVLRVVFRLNLSHLMTFFYMLLFAIAALIIVQGNESFLALAFASGGVTTGPITVPFIMALGVGVAAALGDKRDRESSFGFIALCSIGPILAVLILGLTANGEVAYSLPDYAMHSEMAAIGETVFETCKEVFVALLPIVAFFFLLQFLLLKLPKKRIVQIVVGIFYTFFGLVIFLTAVAVGFMPVGYKMGAQLAEHSPVLLVAFAFLLGVPSCLPNPRSTSLTNRSNR